MIRLSVKNKKYYNSIIGLLGKKQPESIVLRTHFGIHTFGLRFPIDVVVLNSQKRVVKLRENLSPWRIFFWNVSFGTVLEVPAGTIQKKKMYVGEKVELIIV